MAALGNAAVLLRDYLAELLHIFDGQHRMLTGVRVVEFTPRRIEVHGVALRVDMDKSDLAREVKAVTYHALEIRATPGGYEATFIVDI